MTYAHPERDLSLTGARWAARTVSTARVAELRAATGLSAAAARILALRSPEAGSPAEDWLEPSIEHLHDPFAMHNMELAVDRLRRAVRDGERLRVVTDYDVDGTTSSLILQAALRVLDPHVRLDYHIPNRFGEGYGFSSIAAEQAAADGVGLVVTADIGVRDHHSVAVARESGVDVLVCDHHLPKGESVPEGATVLCPPQQACSYPNGALAACGVSLKLAEALLADHPKREVILRSMLKLAAVGTVADMVPLDTLENRAIVTLGLHALNGGPHHAGLRSLIAVSGLEAGQIRPVDLGFRLGPRINAAGRVADATLVVELLTSRDPSEAQELAERLDQLNRQRKDIQRKLVQEALERIGDTADPFVVLSGPESEGWHRGVVGIAAARVKDEVHRPVAIVSVQGDLAVGSVRSVPAVHAVHALDSVSDLLLKHGGHPAAAGFTVRTKDLDTLRERLCAYVSSQAEEAQLIPIHEIDAEIEPAELTPSFLEELQRLGPFGQANPEPVFLVRGARPFSVQVRGRSGTLLKFLVPCGSERSIEAVWWDRADLAEQVDGAEVDLLCHLGENTWQGRRRLQLEVCDARWSSHT